jgi:murein DD-endopeptidase MepM/ murein hydrolase activator NlpD
MAQRAGQWATKQVVRLGKKLVLNIGRMVVTLLVKTAPVWGPFAFLLLLSYGSYMMVYGIPRSAAEDVFSTNRDRVDAFYGFSESKEFINKNEVLFERYEEIAAQWDDDLDDVQKSQVDMHAFSWAILLSVDRLIHDPMVTKKKDIEINPTAVYEDLRPRFEWKDSTITTRTVVCTTDEEGNTIAKTIRDETPVKLIVKSNTVEGGFIYHYKWMKETSGSGCGSVTTAREEVNGIDYPKIYYQPLFSYLQSKGIVHKLDIELVMELARVYDPNYGMNLAIKQNFDYAHYPVINGNHGWQWVTASNRVTGSFGYRTAPKPEFHLGVDIGAINPGYSGDPIYAMESGKIIRSVSDCHVGHRKCGGGYGNVVYIDHGQGIETRYAHMSTNYIKQGEWVEKGTLIGRIGNTGNSTGVHLHFEFRKDNVPLDPLYYFSF